jgi:hypothetical protein
MKLETLKNRKNAWFFCDLTARFCCLDGKKTSRKGLQFVLRESSGHLLRFSCSIPDRCLFFSTLNLYLCWNLFGLWNLFTLTFLDELKKKNWTFQQLTVHLLLFVSSATCCNLFCFFEFQGGTILSTNWKRICLEALKQTVVSHCFFFFYFEFLVCFFN